MEEHADFHDDLDLSKRIGKNHEPCAPTEFPNCSLIFFKTLNIILLSS